MHLTLYRMNNRNVSISMFNYIFEHVALYPAAGVVFMMKAALSMGPQLKLQTSIYTYVWLIYNKQRYHEKSASMGAVYVV